MKDLMVMDARSKGPTIALIQEPYLGTRGFPTGLGRPTDCLVGAKDARAAVVGIKADLRLCPDLSNRDTTTCQLTNGSKSIYLVSSYWDGKASLPDILDTIIERARDDHIIIGMDSNAHSTIWGCKESDGRGSTLEDFIFSNNLVVLNRGNKETFLTSRASSIIDITICSRNMVSPTGNWKVDERDHFSDHRRITFSVLLKTIDVRTRIKSIKKADWATFEDTLEKFSRNFKGHKFWTVETVDREAKRLNLDIKTGLELACPVVRGRKAKSQIWWSKELDILRNKARNLQQHAMRHRGCLEKWNLYKIARKEFKDEVRKAKKESWRTFVKDTPNMESMANLARCIFRKNVVKMSHLR